MSIPNLPSDKTRFTAAETAKLVRATLRADFPGVKFSIRSRNYAGGASIDVSWLDGPCTAEVRAVTQLYTGSTFDGMTDCKSYHDAVLVDEHGAPRVVHFGADHILDQRSYSAATVERMQREIEQAAGDDAGSYDPNRRYMLGAMRAMDHPDELTRFVGGDGQRVCDAFRGGHCFAIDRHSGEYGSTLIHQYLYDKRLPIAPKDAERSY